MHSRGSGFFDVAYTTLTIGNILTALLFFATPSTAMSILQMAISVLLLIDMIIILAVPQIRVEEGWIGIASVVWAALIGAYNVITNRTVKWGKAEEEERLTGRQETRRSLREWCAVFTATFLMVIFVIIAVLLTATLVLRSRDATLKSPGERYLVDGDKYAVHFACVGNQTYQLLCNFGEVLLFPLPVLIAFEMNSGCNNHQRSAWILNVPSPQHLILGERLGHQVFLQFVFDELAPLIR